MILMSVQLCSVFRRKRRQSWQAIQSVRAEFASFVRAVASTVELTPPISVGRVAEAVGAIPVEEAVGLMATVVLAQCASNGKTKATLGSVAFFITKFVTQTLFVIQSHLRRELQNIGVGQNS